jgi:hypothetical protein
MNKAHADCHGPAHIIRKGYRSAAAADKYAAQTPPAGRVYVVKDNHPDPEQATALDIWCVPS